ncbi:MAG TPA: 50S ribosomal protein L37ae [Candidatus Nanoarchaeia archaeon]|nr:50S ribosomal protein L37ae [Candidatus Nanoarchaeia archaeon]
MAEINIKSTKRFGARYGPRLRRKVGEIEHLKRNSTKCPMCNKDKVRREAMGIWFCTTCKKKFAGKAFTFTRKKTLQQLQEEIAAREALEQAKEQIAVAEE